MSDENEMVPDGWSLKSIDDVVESKILGTTCRGLGDTNILLLKMGNISGGCINYKKTEYVRFSGELENLILKYGDFLFNTRNTPELVGKVSNFRDRNKRVVYDNNLLRLRFVDRVESVYMGYLFNWGKTIKQLKQIVAGTTSVAAIYWNDLSRLQVPLPPLPEQKKIAAILSSVDDVIEKTEAQINKLQDLKKGMMQELLTKGIGHTEFKDSPVGRIPESWEVKTLGDLAIFNSGYAFKSKELTENGDILFSWAGVANSINVHHYDGEKALINQHIYNFKFETEEIKEWTYQLLKSLLPKLKKSIEGGAGQLHLTKPFIQSISILHPPRYERKIIANNLISVDKKIHLLERRLCNRKNLKKALMQDLLTGQIRVSTNENNKEAAVG